MIRKFFSKIFVLSSIALSIHVNAQVTSSYSTDTSLINQWNDQSFQLIKIKKDPDSASALAHRAIALSKKTNYLRGLGDGYTRLGLIEKNKGNYKGAIAYYQQSLSFRKQIGNRDLIARVYSNVGIAYNKISQYDSAIHYLLMANEIAEELQLDSAQADYLMNLGIAYQNYTDFDKAIDCHKKSMELYRKLNDSVGIMQTNLNIGKSYQSKKMFRESIRASNIAFQFAQGFEDVVNKSKALSNLALAYKNLGLTDSAIYFGRQALELKKNSGDKGSIATAMSNLGIMFGEKQKNDSALFYLNESMKLAEVVGDLTLMATNHEQLAIIYSAMRNYSAAFEHQKMFSVYQDSVYNAEKAIAIADMQTKYETEKKEKTIVLKENELQRMRQQEYLQRSIIIGSILLLLVVILLFNRFRLKQLQRRETERIRISTDLHDEVGSTLSSIGMYSSYATDMLAQKKMEEALPVLEEISESSQQMIEDMNDIVWAINPRNDSFEHIVNRLSNYASNMAQSKNIALHFTADEALNEVSLPMEERKNLYLICKEAINNAVKYSGCKNLTVQLKKSRRQCEATVSDDGSGFDPLGISPGNGLKNMKMRASLIHSHFDLQSAGGSGTQIVVRIPLA